MTTNQAYLMSKIKETLWMAFENKNMAFLAQQLKPEKHLQINESTTQKTK